MSILNTTMFPGSRSIFREMGIKPLTLQFDGQNERDFCESYQRESITQVRIAMIIGILIFVLFAPLDMVLAPLSFTSLLFIRFGVMLPLSIVQIGLTFWGPVKRHLQVFLIVWICNGCLGVFALVNMLPPETGHVYYISMIIGIMYSFTISRIRFLWAAGASAIVLSLFAVHVWYLHPAPLIIALSFTSFVSGAVAFSLLACYMIELYNRKNYYFRRLYIAEQRKADELNRQLEHRVAERTAQLEQANEELRREAEMRSISVDALVHNEEKYRGLFESFAIPILITRSDWMVSDVNQASMHLFGRDEPQMIGVPIAELFYDRSDFEHIVKELADAGHARNTNVAMLKGDGARIECILSVSSRTAEDGDVQDYQVFVNDITEHRKLQSQLIQAQKMELVGRLAGGIAHDFNNLLTVIIGNADIITLLIGENEQIAEHVQEIKHTAERANNLTRQLLAFSRRQIIEPRVINANEILLDMDKMFRRIIGEDVELVTLLEEQLWPVKIDPGQIEQVLTNIVVNARDAMPTGGKLTIETANVTLDDEFIAAHEELTAGDYVMVAVSDTGLGMSQEVANRIFEPFYTTKEKGKGTGLGLSTCFGIIKQNSGHIMVHSKIGHGTTFVAYLPRSSGVSESVSFSQDTDDLPGGTETVLIAEDEPSVRQMLSRVLADAGYHVIEAFNGEEALRKCELHGFRNIDLLVTDMVMPQMGGRELADAVVVKNPFIRILFISGYTDDLALRDQVLEDGAVFLQKPFSPATIVRKVRALLDEQESREQ